MKSELYLPFLRFLDRSQCRICSIIPGRYESPEPLCLQTNIRMIMAIWTVFPRTCLLRQQGNTRPFEMPDSGIFLIVMEGNILV